MARLDAATRLLSPTGKDTNYLIAPWGRVLWTKPGAPAYTVPGVPVPPVAAETAERLLHPYWTTPLHPQSREAATSAAMVQALAVQFESETFVNGAPKSGAGPLNMFSSGGFRTDVSTGDYSITVYRMPEGYPRQKVAAIRGGFRSKYYDAGTRRYMQDDLDEGGGVPLPPPSDLPDGLLQPQGDDGSVIVIQGNRLWELWRLKAASSGGVAETNGYAWQCDQGGVIADVRYHPGWWSSSNSGVTPRGGDFGVSAAGVSYLGGMLTKRDWARFRAGQPLDHMLFCAIPVPGAQTASVSVAGSVTSPKYVLPATRGDDWNFTSSSNATVAPYRVPEGTRYRLPAASWTDAQIATYAQSKGLTSASTNGSRADVLAWILTGIRDYGFMVVDAAGIIGFSAEANKTYRTAWNPWPADQGLPSWGDFVQQIPFRQLRQVEVPTVQIHTPGQGATTPQPAAYDYTIAPEFPAIDTLVTGRNFVLTKSDFPPVIRYAETGRRKVVVRNADPSGREVGVGYSTAGNDSGNGPANWTAIPAGSEWVDTSGNGQRLLARTTPGQSTSGNVTVEVYVEVAP